METIVKPATDAPNFLLTKGGYFEKILAMESETRRKFTAVALALVVVGAAFFSGVGIGYANRPAVEKVANIISPEVGKPDTVDFSLFWEVWKRVEDQYVDKGAIDRKKLVDGAIQGMVKAVGDPYTVFLPPEETKQFQEGIQGSFEGIGAEIGMRKGIVTIVAPLKGSPAEKAGLKAGDKILKIDDTPSADLSVDEAVKLIRGKKGTVVKLTIFRDSEGAPQEISITRNTIVIPNIKSELKPGNVFLIQLSQFSRNSSDDFANAVRDFERSGASKLVLDLRNNPGGYLDSAVSVASWFVPSGKTVVIEKWNDGHEERYTSKGYRIFENVPTVVLIDQGSASASEIVAGALRDNNGIKLVGEKTFGKGSVQEYEDLRGGASLKVTVAKWLTPSGKSINGSGLEPDIRVEATSTPDRDLQLEKAMEILK